MKKKGYASTLNDIDRGLFVLASVIAKTADKKQEIWKSLSVLMQNVNKVNFNQSSINNDGNELNTSYDDVTIMFRLQANK